MKLTPENLSRHGWLFAQDRFDPHKGYLIREHETDQRDGWDIEVEEYIGIDKNIIKLEDQEWDRSHDLVSSKDHGYFWTIDDVLSDYPQLGALNWVDADQVSFH